MAEEKGERKQYREFTVTPGICGFSVRMGCSTLFFGDAEELTDAIVDYLRNPWATEKRFLRRDHRLNNGPPAATDWPNNPILAEAAEPGSLPQGRCPNRPAGTL